VTTWSMKTDAQHCPSALQSGSICWYVDVREDTIEEQACPSCQRAAGAPPTLNPRIPPCVPMQNYVDARGRQECPQMRSPFPARTTTFGGIHEQPHYRCGKYQEGRGWSPYLADLMEQNTEPMIPFQRCGHQSQQHARTRNKYHFEQELPYGNISDFKTETPYSEKRIRPGHPSAPDPTRDQAEARAYLGEEAELQRALDHSWYEHQLEEVKRTSINQARRISALEEQFVWSDRRNNVIESNARLNGNNHSAEKDTWNAVQKMPNSPTVSYPEHRGLCPPSQKLHFISNRTGRNRKVWVCGVRKVNGRLYEHRKRLNSWEYEVFHRP